MSLQLTFAFPPSWSWWTAREAQVAIDEVIEYALACAAVAPSRGRWGQQVVASSDASAPMQLEFWSADGSAPIDLSKLQWDTGSDDLEDGDDEEAPEAEASPADAVAATPDGIDVHEAREAWLDVEAIVNALREAGVTGNPDVVRLLALLASPVYREHGYGPRFLLTAPPSAGKTFLLGALADALGVPSLHIDASILTPEGWAGTNVSDLIDARIGHGPGQYSLEQWSAGAVLVLDEIDKACRSAPDDRHGTAVRLERQHAMLGLVWGGTPIRLKNGASIRTDRWIVAACGAFATTRFASSIRTGAFPRAASVASRTRCAGDLDQ